jgi:RimJ/RimL family protein N-acetyltransferase
MDNGVLSRALRELLTTYFPQFGVRIVTPRLTLQMPTDVDLVTLLELIDRGIHDPSEMPFLVEWTDAVPPQRDWESLAHWWRGRATWSPEKWAWCGMVTVGDTVVGVQDILANNFHDERVVETGSWLGRAHQGQGIGREMRAAILHFAFAGLGATQATSGYLAGNVSSQRVSESLGYRVVGDEEITSRGRPRRTIKLALDRAEWEAQRRDDIRIEGLDAARERFGATTVTP